MDKLTKEQLHILQHSLGLDQYGQGKQYRNRFVTGPECDNWRDLRSLVRAGFMKDHGPMSITGGMHCFSVTPNGIDAVALQSPAPPKLTRAQRRYQRYLDIGECFDSFRDFLIYETAKEKETANSWY